MPETPATFPLPDAAVIDARVRLPSPLRVALRDAGEVYDDYDAVLDIGAAWTKSVGELRAEMDAAGVDHAIVHAEYEQGDVADAFNDELGRLVAQEPARFSGFGTVSLDRLDIMRAVRQVERVGALGLRGVNLQPSFFGLALDDRRMYPIYAKATELGLAIALHTGVNYSRSHPIEAERPVRLDQIACDFREATLIACHGAWPWVPEIVAVARRHPNVLIDFGGLAPKYVGMPGSGWELLRHFMDRGLRDQVLFATDWPVFPQQRALEEWRDLDLREETLAALLAGNARRLLAGTRDAVPA
ncbi:amidohydrolase family protein [Conexibacter woesei]|uniref:Amidohydrolase 2 n=1 Tax=Conexibacter woesei (strain DSM 14684 / CCUG 47730 / CIP 108061 / JCM 11494 / NBRC 100937 / ID131577) TaxID=469383 RepID=D3F5I9_CONWI|nr:amidohydrolase family protein [Conexibacter woesei]ADB50656.1 amidohydrolase 2 [Conexibacter woesei DSM 14684]